MVLPPLGSKIEHLFCFSNTIAHINRFFKHMFGFCELFFGKPQQKQQGPPAAILPIIEIIGGGSCMRTYKGNSLIDFTDSYVVIDIETTGLDPEKDSIIEIAAIKVVDSKIVDSFSSLINPGFIIPEFIIRLTKITNEQLSSAPSLSDVLHRLNIFLGDYVLVGHNINFDINFLYDGFEKILNHPLSNDFIDTLRLSKRYVKNLPSYKLKFLADYFKLPVSIHHRAMYDCETTYQLYLKLFELSQSITEDEQLLIDSLCYDEANPFYRKKLVIKGLPQYYSYNFYKQVAKKCGAILSDSFYSNSDYIIFSKYTYNRFIQGYYSEKFEKAKKLSESGNLIILSENKWCEMLGLSIPHNHHLNAKDITTSNTEFDESHPLYGKVCVFTGTLEKMPRKDAMQLVVDVGGIVGNSVTKKTNYLILGNNDYCPLIKDGKSSKQKKAEALKLSGQDIDIITENVFYDMMSYE